MALLSACLLCAAGWKLYACWQMDSPIFVDEVLYADVAHEIAAHWRWQMRYDGAQSVPPWYSAILAPSFLLRAHYGMEGVYRGFTFLNNVLALAAVVVAMCAP